MPRTEVQDTASGWTWLCFECGEGGIAGGKLEPGHHDLYSRLYDQAKTSATEHQCPEQS